MCGRCCSLFLEVIRHDLRLEFKKIILDLLDLLKNNNRSGSYYGLAGSLLLRLPDLGCFASVTKGKKLIFFDFMICGHLQQIGSLLLGDC